MSFKYINKFLIILPSIVLLSCQDILQSNKITNDNYNDQSFIEINEILDTNFYENYEENLFDFYTNQSINYDFTKKKLDRIKIKNFLNINDDLNPINLIYDEFNFYSLDSDGNILKLDKKTGKLIDIVKLSLTNYKFMEPISFSLIDDNFIIAFKSGEIIKCTKKGKVLWQFRKDYLLNTPLKITNDYIIALYPEDIILLSNDNGTILFQENYRNSNIIQSNGGKLKNYFNFLYFILPNSSFGSIDTYLFDKHISEIDNIQIKTSLNNLNDNLHIYQNFLVYVDNGNQLFTFDIVKNEFLLKDFILNNVLSYTFYNNSLVVLKNNSIEFYNIKNGNTFFSIDIEKKIKNNTKIIKIFFTFEKIHILFDTGHILILDDKKNDQTIDLKIKDINYVYNSRDLFFVSTKKGITYIY
ncbi:MAG: hypothetical protein ACJ0RJ_02675 [Alphaproteobacteria bacterium]|tara:strand:+ start:1331 stop:2569 length:1239 start_codon:yes stop_codon:yes gene_type:complete